MSESLCSERRLEILRASCTGPPREMVNLFLGPMKSLFTSERIEKALDRLRQRHGVSRGLTNELQIIIINIRRGSKVVFLMFRPLHLLIPALGVLVKSVHLVAGRLGFYSQSGHTKDFKNSIRSFRVRRSAQAEVRRVLCKCCSSCMFLNSVQSFVIENCDGPTIENGLNNVCLHPLSRTFTFYIF